MLPSPSSQRKEDEEHPPKSPSLLSDEENQALSPTSPTTVHITEMLHDTSLDYIEQEQSNENPTSPLDPRSTPFKPEFDYGGFVETPPPQDTDDTTRSSQFGKLTT